MPPERYALLLELLQEYMDDIEKTGHHGEFEWDCAEVVRDEMRARLKLPPVDQVVDATTDPRILEFRRVCARAGADWAEDFFFDK